MECFQKNTTGFLYNFQGLTYKNCCNYKNNSVFQVDIYNLPLKEKQFDIVVCVGVIKHTPDTELTLKYLCSYLKDEGILLFDHYSEKYPYTASRRILRDFILISSNYWCEITKILN
ncbi:MAG: 2-polyprenyl-3-methyl-5-hydroxy-6-metoxy-1,4-benzoquinol methylase [uncultured bacterium]|nr:MAG: 2-polyprenyl-3-methyl-5-hydroxy-6-metoxy-1,4-benzoquinol methylase [uncultured bacterium]